MIIETTDLVCAEIVDRYVSTVKMNFDVVFDYTNYYDMYNLLMQIVWTANRKQDRFIVNSAITYFIFFREYILGDRCKGNDEGLLLDYFEKIMIRFRHLINIGRETVYLYKPTLEVKEFCRYYSFIYYEVRTKKELYCLMNSRVKKGNIL